MTLQQLAIKCLEENIEFTLVPSGVDKVTIKLQRTVLSNRFGVVYEFPKEEVYNYRGCYMVDYIVDKLICELQERVKRDHNPNGGLTQKKEVSSDNNNH